MATPRPRPARQLRNTVLKSVFSLPPAREKPAFQLAELNAR